MVVSGNEVCEWILAQNDLWNEEKQSFHVGLLQKRFEEIFSALFETFDEVQRRQLLQTVALEAKIAAMQKITKK